MIKNFFKSPEFVNSKGESLPLPEIVNKKITSVVVTYLSAEKRKEQIGISGFFGFFSDVQDKKNLVIDNGRIHLLFLGGETATVFFSSEEEFKKIEGYDENSLWKSPIKSATDFFQINIPKSSLKEIDWV